MLNARFATPSYVIPANTRENILFLQNRVAEIALIAFEPSLPSLSDLTFFKGTWHIHLPYLVPHDFFSNSQKYCIENPQYTENTKWVDVWKLAHSLRDIEEFCQSTINIIRHCKQLQIHSAVLHLPNKSLPNARKFLAHFLRIWEKHLPLSMLCLENVRNASYLDFQESIMNTDVSLCFDIAHALTYKQTNLLYYPNFMKKVKIVHWSAPFSATSPEYGKDKHLGLYHLKTQKEYCISILNAVPKTATHVLEIFSWKEVEKSLPFFQNLFTH